MPYALYNPTTHEYFLNGRWVPARDVADVTRPPLPPDKLRMADAILRPSPPSVSYTDR